jgi:hypothetical protein
VLRAVAATAVLTLAACGGSADPVVKLDGSPRTPDVEGIVVAASASGITLDGDREYEVAKKLISFSTYNHEVVPLASTVGAYVQAGVKGSTIVWISKIGPVATDPSGHKTVQYQGDLVDVRPPRLIFRDGTVLRLADGLKPPADPEGPTYAVIDADKHVVQGATFAPPRTKN